MAQKTPTAPTVERTEEQVVEALKAFAQASVESVGVARTYDTLTFLTKVIRDSPDTYQKIFHPKTLGKIEELVENGNKGKKLGIMDAMSLFSELQEILK